MISRLLIIALLLSLVGCKSYEYKAQNKSELSKLCLYNFPFDNTPDRIEVDTIYKDVEKIIEVEVDCDTIGKKKVDVPIKEVERVINNTEYKKDPACLYYAQSLEAQIDALNERLIEKDKAHEEQIKTLQKSHKKELKQSLIYRNILLALILLVGARFLIRGKIF